MLTRVKIKDFKCIRTVDIPLSPLTAFVGPNDSGKTTILKAIQIGVTGEMELSRELAIAFPDLSLAPSTADASLSTVTLWQDASLSEFRWERQFKIEIEKDETHNLEFVQPIVKGDGPSLPTIFYNPRPDLLKRPSDSPEKPYALPSKLARLLGEDREVFLEIEKLLHEWVPTVESIILKRGPDRREDLMSFKLPSGEVAPSIIMSDGTLLLLEYLTLLLAPPRPKILLIDGPEEGIHPRALEKLVNFFRSIQSEDPDLQILMSSHSADLLSFLEPKEIVVTHRGEDGYTQAARLDQHPDLDQWLEGLTPGEFWLWDGEAEILQRIRDAREKQNE
ncbi:MAG: AAA family ATPase [Chloroflexi bacterium]|jgi:energy-coupling factor transporter ATP-binding protein EcfA2|nr:AAA family ATPase [Chloroflexota bacterium]